MLRRSDYVGRLGYGRQRRDLLADKQREADRQRVEPLMKAFDRVEPALPRVSFAISEGTEAEEAMSIFNVGVDEPIESPIAR